LSTATVDVVLHLINFKCVPVLMYSLEFCPLNRADMQSLDFCVNRLLMKLFCNNNNLSTIEECIDIITGRQRSCKPCTSYDRHVRPSVRLSVCPSVRLSVTRWH